MAKGPTWNDVGDPKQSNRIESRECGGYFNPRTRMGKSSFDLRCPFCQSVMTAYRWSFAATGKRCQCGALAGPSGTFHHFADRKN